MCDSRRADAIRLTAIRGPQAGIKLRQPLRHRHLRLLWLGMSTSR